MKNPLDSEDTPYRTIVEESTEFAIFIVDAEGLIQTWNPGAERMFQWTAGEAIGLHFSNLFTEEDRRNGAPERELAKARQEGRAPDDRWHLRKDGTLFFTEGVTTALAGHGSAPGGFTKIARDVTARYRSEQRLAAQMALTRLLDHEEPQQIVARRVMQTICENLGWDLGALWEVDEQQERIHCVDQWHTPDVDETAARELCAGVEFARGEGLPGRVWASGESLWLTDLSDATSFPRAPRAVRSGLRSAFAFPIVHKGIVRGVMEFFSREVREPDQPLMPVMMLIGAQIGDFLENRRTSNALRESEERYRLISDNAQDAIFTINEQSTILFCNPAVERIYGYKPAELVGQKLEIIIPERFRERHREGIQRFLRTRKRNIPWNGVELPSLHRDGHEFPSEISFGEWTGAGGTIFTGYARDITERKRAAEALQRSLEEAHAAKEQLQRRADEESAFRHLASALTGAVEMTDVLYEITNRATVVTRADGVYVERILGPSNIVEVVATAGRGTPPRGLRVAFPGSMTSEIMRGGQPVILSDMKGFGPSMAPYIKDTCEDCQVLVTPLVSEDEPLGALVLLNSRNSGREFKEPDIVRVRTLGDLTSLALRRVRLLEQERSAREKAEAAVRVRDETLGIVSHDLRNPLTKIGLSAELLIGATAEEQQDLIHTIRMSAQQMDRLIQDLLDVARVEAGRLSVDKEVIPSESLVRDSCESNQPIATQRKQRIVCKVIGELPNICADNDRMLQVFGNLIGNAIKFAPDGGIITVEAEAVDDMVEFRIGDNGPGIPEADLGNVFRPYWQAKKTAHMGAGLGLAIVRGIIEAHGGTVWADNAPSGGALFTFTIPRA